MNLIKKISYPLILVAFLGFIVAMSFGAIVKYTYEGGERFQFIQKPIMLIADLPFMINYLIESKKINPNSVPKLKKHQDKKRFEQFIANKRNALLVMPRYDHSLNRSVVDILDLNDFKIIHTFKHDIAEMNNQITNIKEFPRLKIDHSPIRFIYQHPLLFPDGSLVSLGPYVFKLDFCSNLKWINDEENFHHSQMLDHEGNMWVGGRMSPKSMYVKSYSHVKDFADDSIIKINQDGKILFNKSVTEFLIENNLIDQSIFKIHSADPIHLNDIEPALSGTMYWEKGDVFLSVRYLSAIIHYRPSSNKVINYITGPFSMPHDVDIISKKEISIFNNNNSFINDEYSNILIYDFENNSFKTLFENQLKIKNFKTSSEGLSHIFEDGSLMVEEQNHGRIILFNNKGNIEWEFVNKDKNGDIGFISWSRVIEDELFIENFKSMVKNKTCLN